MADLNSDFFTQSFPLLLTSSNDSSFAGFFDESLVALSGVDVGAAADDDDDEDVDDDEDCVCDEDTDDEGDDF